MLQNGDGHQPIEHLVTSQIHTREPVLLEKPLESVTPAQNRSPVRRIRQLTGRLELGAMGMPRDSE
jgi:hypothetical protein